jgi:S1-C subfamily serine protease
MRFHFAIIAMLLPLAAVRAASGELLTFEKASAQLQAATVTVKVIPAKDNGAKEPTAEEELAAELTGDGAAKPAPRSVVVCSGVSLGDGLVVTYAEISGEDEVRITIPGGQQARATLKVLDHVSGLTLLETDKHDVPGLKAAKDSPDVGAWVLAGAGWGSEQPVVSFGILSATQRSIRGATFPPLLQCDLRTADTSNGAPLVNQHGELIGVIVATEAAKAENRWTYAVPASHVQRLVKARHPDKMIRLLRQRPVVGLELVPGDVPGTVLVQRVDKDGPAEAAGIRVGDQVIAADGTKIRSVYEVIRPLLAKQPGETMQFVIQQSTIEKRVTVVLDGGAVIHEAPNFTAASGVAPAGKVEVRELGFAGQTFNVTRDNAARAPAVAQPVATSEQVELLQKQLDRYGTALETLNSELKRRDQELAQRNALIESLQQQLQAAQQKAAR